MPLRQIIYQTTTAGEEPIFLEESELPKLRAKPLSTLKHNRQKIRVGILSDYLQEPIVQAINIAASTLNLSLEALPFAIEAIENSILDLSHAIYNQQIDILMVYPDYLKSISVKGIANAVEGSETGGVKKAFEKWSILLSTFTARIPIPILIHNAPEVTSTTSGEYFKELNNLFDTEKFENCYWVDLATLSQKRQPWFDNRLLEIARFPFALENINIYIGELTAKMREILRRPIKIVVTDLDDTLWDGILGEHDSNSFARDLDAVSLDNDRKIGIATILAELISEGYLVAIATKNDESKVHALFDIMTDFPIKKDDLFGIYANWGPKSDSIQKVLMSTGFREDALLFIDDSPFECLEVKNSHPSIVAINVSEQQNLRRENFMELGYFREKSATDEDNLRKASYVVTTQLQNIEDSIAKIDFLKSLEMKISVKNTDTTNLVRVEQMHERTNQFRANSTFQWLTSQKGVTQIKIELRDNFTDYGIIGILDYSFLGQTIRIHQWLMSCRVFSRGVEEYTLLHLIRLAVTPEFKLDRIEIGYTSTGRNKYFFEKMKQLGFYETDNGLTLSDFKTIEVLEIYIVEEL